PWTADTRQAERLYAVVVPPPWSNTDAVISKTQQQLRAHPNDEHSYVVLGEAYEQEARDVGDPTYYAKADAVLQQARKRQPDDAEAIAAQGSLALSRHDFVGALALCQQAHQLDPYSANVLGIISDADVQLGKDADAIQSAQQMVNLRPDLSSYSRISYIRELHGDFAGAISAMQAAAIAGGPAAENVAWTSWQLGTLYFDEGKLDAAQHAFEHGLAIYPKYMHCEAGLAMVAAARGDYQTAIADYNAALNVMPFPLYIINLGDVYAAAGQPQDAAREYGLVAVIEKLFQANGVNVDMELALYQADHHQNLPQALALAQQNNQLRPSVMAADALAWTRYQSGDCRGAAAAERQAMRLGTRLPLMLFHAGMIARCAGDTATATADLQQAIALNPHFSVLYDGVAETTVAAITGGSPASARERT
ncbi:MAG TPA: tetratricopeptide repeat protein, partial [Chloroflexota bacterium]